MSKSNEPPQPIKDPGYRAISFVQPWAWLVMNAGMDVFNRQTPWATRMPRRVLIHASERLVRREIDDAFAFMRRVNPKVNLPDPMRLDRGGFVGAATVFQVQFNDHLAPIKSKWCVPTMYGHILRSVEPVPFTPYVSTEGTIIEVPRDLVQQMFRNISPHIKK